MSSSGKVLVGALLDRRRAETDRRFENLRKELKEAEKLTAGNACVYAIGSFGRNEAGPHSDLDLFIAGREDNDGDRLLRRLDEIRIKANLIDATRKLEIPDFSGDGEYLKHYTVGELVRTLGTPEDDISNTFTARLLLILESRPLLEEAVYSDILEKLSLLTGKITKSIKMSSCPHFLQMTSCVCGEPFV